MKKIKLFNLLSIMFSLFALLLSLTLVLDSFHKSPEIRFSTFLTPQFFIFIFLLAISFTYIKLAKNYDEISEELELKSTLFDGVLESSSIGLIITNLNGEVILCNKYAKEHLALSCNNKDNIFNFFNLDDILIQKDSVSNNQALNFFDYEIKISGEKRKYIDLTILETEETGTYILLFNDKTDFLEVKNIAYLRKELLEAMEEAVVLVDDEGNIVEFNDAFSRLMRLPCERLKTVKLFDVLVYSEFLSEYPDEIKKEFYNKLKRIVSTGDMSILKDKILKFNIASPEKKHYQQKVFKVNLNNKYLLGSITIDVTQLENLLEEVKNANSILEQRIEEAKKELELKLQELDKINEELRNEIELRRKTEEQLKLSEARYKNFIDNLPVGVYRTTFDGEIILANQSLAKTLGCGSVEELLRSRAFDFYIDKSRRSKVLELHSSETHGLIKVETEMITKDGKKIIVEDYGKGSLDTESMQTFFDGIIIDVTEKFKFQRELEKREKLYRQLFERLNEILIQINSDGVIELVSPSINKVLGYSPDKLIGQNLSSLLEKPEWLGKIFQIINESGYVNDLVMPFISQDEGIKFLKGDYFMFVDELSGLKIIEALLRDVTEDLENQNYINAMFSIFRTFSREKDIFEIADNIYKTLQNLTIVPNYVFALKAPETNSLKIVRHNDRYGHRFITISLEDERHPLIKSIKLNKILVLKDDDLVDFWFDKRFQQPTYLISIPLVCGNNVLGLIATYTYAQEQKLSKTRLYLLSSIAEQISIGLERKFLADKLKIQLKLFESLVEAIPYPIYYRDLVTKKYRYCNASFEKFVGKKREQIIGKTVEEVLPKELSDLILEKDDELRKGTSKQHFELKLKTASNEERTFISIRSPLLIEELKEEAVVGILIDITERLNYEFELKKALEYNELLLNLVPSGFFTFDKEKRITFWNKQAEIITGYKSEDVVGNLCFICVGTTNTKQCPILDFSSEVNYVEMEQKFIRKDGSKILLFKKVAALFDKDNNIIGGIEAFEDITLRKQAQQRLEYLAETNSRLATISSFATNVDDFETLCDIILPVGQQISQSSGICFIELNKNMGKTFVSNIIQYKISYGREATKTMIPIEKIINTYVGKIFVEKASFAVENPEESKIFEEVKFLNNERFVGIPVESGEELYGILIVYGKNSEYLEEEMISLERLALIFATNLDRIKYQHELQNILNKQLEINELRSNFINLISHEYRTPLQAVILSSEILKKHFDKLTPEQKEKQFKIIEKAVSDMSQMLENVILYNKLTQPTETVQLENVNAKSFFSSLVQDFQLFYQDKAKINYQFVSALSEVRVDQKLMQIILSNLLSNAVKYSQPNSEINISVKIEEKTLVVSVRDNGIGIEKEEVQKIFEPFYRGKNTKTIAGTGLGLSIVSNSVRLLGGKINVESEVGNGTIFEIQIPLI